MRSRCAQPDVFRAIARPVRRAILDRLRGGEQPVRAIAEPFAMTLSGVSQQLRLLRNAGLVRERRDGRHDTIGSARNRARKCATGRSPTTVPSTDEPSLVPVIRDANKTLPPSRRPGRPRRTPVRLWDAVVPPANAQRAAMRA